ncbi:MAG: lipoprotein-releasing ABC transporter permease subunit [Burkholderiales bacterium]
MRYELFVGLRYTRSRRRNNFVSFISLISMLGIALGVAALIVVLSVMNGFQRELRSRILGVAAHVQITGPGEILADWTGVAAKTREHPGVVAAAPYVTAQSMISRENNIRGAIVRGIEPALESGVAELGRRHMVAGRLDALQPGEYGIVLGVELARYLQARVGDRVTLIAPQGLVTPAGVIPRLKQFRVVGLFEVGLFEYDGGLALVHIDDAQRLYRMGGQVSGVRLRLADLFEARTISKLLGDQLSGTMVTDWTQSHASFFRAVQVEKNVMFFILTLIVMVAAFNIVSTLIMVVTDKQSDIAILRTLGASPASIMRIFVIQGFLIGVVGTLAGLIGGVALAINVDVVVPFLERMLNLRLLDPSVYYISELPSELQRSDVMTIAMISLALSLAATLYPSWRAARVRPAEALRYE